MKKLSKVLIYSLLILALLVITAITVITMVIDPNNFKEPIATAISNSTGRQLIIKGDIHWQFYPRVGMKIGHTALQNPQGFDSPTFISVNNASVAVQLIPLFSKKVHIASIELDGLQLNLMVNKQGQNNWDDILSKSAATDELENYQKHTVSALDKDFSLEIASISVSNANVSLENQQTKEKFSVNDFSLQSLHIAKGEAFPVAIQFALASTTPDIHGAISIDSNIFFDPDVKHLQLSEFNIKADLLGEDVPSREQRIDLALESLYLKLDPPRLVMDDLKFQHNNLQLLGHLKASYKDQKPKLDATITIPNFNLQQYLAKLDSPWANMTNDKSLTRAFGNLRMSLDKNVLNISPLHLELDNSRLETTARVRLDNYYQPDIDFTINMNEINLDNYQLVNPRPQVATSSEASALFAQPGDLFGDERKEFNPSINGSINIGRIKVARLAAGKVQAKINKSNDLITIKPITARLYNGNYNGALSFNLATNPISWTLNQALDEVNIQPLLVDFYGFEKITGLATSTMQLTGSSFSDLSARKSLNGRINLTIANGIYHGIDLDYYHSLGRSLLKRNSKAIKKNSKQTPFLNLSANTVINNGIASNDDLRAYNPALYISGKGQIDLVKEQINYQFMTSKAVASTQADGTIRYQPTGKQVPIAVTGKITEPKIGVTKENLRDLGMDIIDQKLRKKLSTTDGDNNSSATKDIPATIIDAIGTKLIKEKVPKEESTSPADNRPAPKDPVDKLNKFIDNIFN